MRAHAATCRPDGSLACTCGAAQPITPVNVVRLREEILNHGGLFPGEVGPVARALQGPWTAEAVGCLLDHLQRLTDAVERVEAKLVNVETGLLKRGSL